MWKTTYDKFFPKKTKQEKETEIAKIRLQVTPDNIQIFKAKTGLNPELVSSAFGKRRDRQKWRKQEKNGSNYADATSTVSEKLKGVLNSEFEEGQKLQRIIVLTQEASTAFPGLGINHLLVRFLWQKIMPS